MVVAAATPSPAAGRPRTRAARRRAVAKSLARARAGRAVAPPPPPAPAGTPDGEGAAAVMESLQRLGMTVEDVQRVVRKRPRVLRLCAEDEIKPVLATLKGGALKLNDKQVRSVVAFAPGVLGRRDAEKTFAPRIEFLLEEVGVPADALAAAVAKRPHVLWMDVAAAREVVARVRAACPLLGADALGPVVARVPQALLARPDDVERNLSFVAGVVRSPRAMARLLAKVPLVLVYAEKTMQARLDVLRALPVDDGVIARIVSVTPDVLQWSVVHKLRPTLAALAEQFGEDHVPEVLDKLPAILDATDTFAPRVEWLRDAVGLSDAEIRTVLRAAPAVLTYSVPDNLAPKWAFVSNTMGGGREDLVAAPREILCANLQQRAMPRYAFAMTHLADCAHSLAVVDIMTGNDAEFCKRLDAEPSVYRAFVEEDKYLLFYSQLI